MNINDYVTQKIIDYLKERDEYINSLERGIRKCIKNDGTIRTTDDIWSICTKCDKLLNPSQYRIRCVGGRCSTTLCDMCSKDIVKYYRQNHDGVSLKSHFYICDKCNSHCEYDNWLLSYTKVNCQ